MRGVDALLSLFEIQREYDKGYMVIIRLALQDAWMIRKWIGSENEDAIYFYIFKVSGDVTG